MKIVLEATEWPVVQLTYPAEVTSGDVARLARRLNELFKQQGAMAIVAHIDHMKAASITPMLRGLIAEEADKLAEQGALLAEAVVVRDPVLRGLHRAYTWARRRQDYPAETFANLRPATEWARTCSQNARAGSHS
jgi:hypothetical protein